MWLLYQRGRQQDRKELAMNQLRHLLATGVTDLENSRIYRFTAPDWYLLKVLHAWWTKQSLLVMRTALYDPQTLDVFDVTNDWRVARTATDMYNHIAEASQALKTPLNELHLHTINWQEHERGYAVWVRTLYAGKRSFVAQTLMRQFEEHATSEFQEALSELGSSPAKTEVKNLASKITLEAVMELERLRDELSRTPRLPGARVEIKMRVYCAQARLRTFQRLAYEAIRRTKRKRRRAES